MYYSKVWFEHRSQIYAELAKKGALNRPLDSVTFNFAEPEVGWIDVSVFVNGEKKAFIPLSDVYDPFDDIKEWLESIVKKINHTNTILIDCESEHVFLAYEHISIYSEEFPNDDKKHRSMGLFYIYNSYDDKILFSALCNTTEFISSFYRSLREMVLQCKEYHFNDHWYCAPYYEDNDDDEEIDENRVFYDHIESSIVESYLKESNQ